MAKLTKTDKVLKQVGQRLKELRILAGYTSYETFAIEHDLSRRYYWGAEKGINVSLKYLIKILDIHHLTIQEFFKGLDKTA